MGFIFSANGIRYFLTKPKPIYGTGGREKLAKWMRNKAIGPGCSIGWVGM